MDRRRASSHLLCLLGIELLAVVLLHELGDVRGLSVPWGSLADWVREAPPEEVLAATLRLVALAGSWWLLGTTVLYAITCAAGLPRAVRAIGCATLPLARRWADRAFAATMVAGVALGVRPAAAAPAPPGGPSPTPPPVVLEVDHRDRGSGVATPTSTPGGRTGRTGGLERAPAAAPAEPQTVGSDPAPPHAPWPQPEPEPALASSYEVQPGDSLWSIARTGLALGTGRSPETLGDEEIASYWATLVEVNRLRLRSGDPDLIFPGELVELPPATD